MKFEEMVSNKSATKKAKTLKIAMLAAIVITVFFVLYFLLKSLMGGNEKPVQVEKLDTNSRLVQSLYTSVHDFKSTSPYWMYGGEKSSIIADMTESNKMVLAYLNLKASDFLEADDCTKLTQENSYGKLVCSDKTIIKREDVERSYKEVFGDQYSMSTGNIKVNPSNDTYIYDESIDSYVLYSKNSGKENFSKDFQYNYNVYQAEREGETIRIYESLEVIDKNNVVRESVKYLYTFKLADDNLYSFFSIEEVK
ncbi:MAG: hypothetical protein MSS28_00640 [Tenericutes bacterium]|nr:hypothetical protein [Mycoplasmatota bacterium]